jgi:hypothetical protein
MFTLSQQVPAGVAGNRLASGFNLMLTGDGTQIAGCALIQDFDLANAPWSPDFNPRTVKNPVALATGIATFSTASGNLVSLAALTPYRSSRASGIGVIQGIEWANSSGDVFVASQGNGKATSNSQAVVGPDGRIALVVVSGGQVTATIPLPAWAASSPHFSGGSTGW